MPFTTPPTFVSGDVLTAAQLNILGDDLNYLNGVATGVTASGVQVYRVTDQAIGTSSATNVSFTTEAFDYGSWWSSGTTITVPAGAIPSGYTSVLLMVIARVQWEANSTGIRRIRPLKNGTHFGSHTTNALSSGTTDQQVTDFTTVVAGDLITLEGYQTSGGNLNVEVSTFTVMRFAPAA